MDEKNDDDVIVFNEPYRSLYDHLDDGESLFEKYFKGENINADKRNYCYMLINNIREVENSRYHANNQSNEFELSSMTFRRIALNKYYFFGVLSNGEESKTADGVIEINEGKIVVGANFYRLYEFLDDDERFYSTVDTFCKEDGRSIRITEYPDGMRYTEPLDLLEGEEVSEYAYQKSKTMIRKRENKMSN